MAPAASKRFVWAVPALPADFIPNGYPDAVAVTASEAGHNIFQVDLKRDWCIGQVPQGGYLMSVAASAVQEYFLTHHKALNQPDLITIHVEFLGRTVIGPAELTITDLKLGRQFSSVRLQLFQNSVLSLEALVTQGNLQVESRSGGMTLPTRPLIPKSDVPPLDSCVERRDPPDLFARRTSYAKTIFMMSPDTSELGASPTLGPSVRDQWVRWRDNAGGAQGEGFSVSSLCFLADTFRPLVEAYGETGNWFPTMCCSIEVKKAPPTARGWEWLFMRVEARQIRHGRNDLEVVILDQDGDIVALAHHTALVVSAERNMKVKVAKI